MPSLFHRAAAVPALAFLVVASALAVTAPPAAADNASTLTVVGTSDVYDSNLVQSVIKPGFEAAYPGITLNYVSKGTGAAIAYAEAGSASALIVHAASLENQFVDQGYSSEQYGRAIFYGDYVLLGPANDPAKVLSGSSHNIVSAFQKIAATGAKGKANFVSRGGTPGTTVQEHAIWALTTGVSLCQVSDLNGGGKVPSTVGVGTDCPTSSANPTWYQTTGLTQGPNLINADACNYPGGGCYAFTDRGTFQYLRSQGSLANLKVVTNNNLKSATGGSTLLVNSFHAYAVNPDKFAGNPNVQINSAGAADFLSWITSPPAQSAIGGYLANDAQNGGPPFIPDAAPGVSTSFATLPTSVAAGKFLSVTGTVSNLVDGTPPLSGVTVTLNFVPSAATSKPPVAVATATTNSTGKYTVTYTPTASGTYTVSTPPISKVEYPALQPPFGDLLAPFTSPASNPVAVAGAVTISRYAGGTGFVNGAVSLAPADSYQVGSLDLYAAQGTDPLQYVSSVAIPVGSKTLAFRYTLPAGTWQVQLHYTNTNVITAGLSDVKTVTVH